MPREKCATSRRQTALPPAFDRERTARVRAPKGRSSPSFLSLVCHSELSEESPGYVGHRSRIGRPFAEFILSEAEGLKVTEKEKPRGSCVHSRICPSPTTTNL